MLWATLCRSTDQQHASPEAGRVVPQRRRFVYRSARVLQPSVQLDDLHL